MSKLKYREMITLATMGLLSSIGCDGGEETDNNIPPMKKTPEQTGPLWAMTTQVFDSGGNATSYLVVSASLDSDEEVPLDDAIELPGRSLGVGTANGAVFATGGEAPTLTRYEESQGKLVKGATLSFANLGLTSIGEYGSQVHFSSATKAYFFDPQTAQVIVWNPTEMVIVESIELPGLAAPNTILAFSQSPVIQDGDMLYTPVGWRGSDNLSIVKRLTSLLALFCPERTVWPMCGCWTKVSSISKARLIHGRWREFQLGNGTNWLWEMSWN